MNQFLQLLPPLKKQTLWALAVVITLNSPNVVLLPCHTAIEAFCMSRGGRNSTTWEKGSSWNQGKTQSIRVPVTLASKIMSYARVIDSGIEPDQQLILRAIDSFVESRITQYHPNQYSCTGSTTSRRWDELRRFRSAIALGTIDHARSKSTSQSQRAIARWWSQSPQLVFSYLLGYCLHFQGKYGSSS